MRKPKLHLPGLFHTINNLSYSHCAFTGKVLRFPRMMAAYGYQVIDYSNAGSESGAWKHEPLLGAKELSALGAFQRGDEFHGNKAVVGSPLHKEFERRLIKAMLDHVGAGDIICHPFGIAHDRLLAVFPENIHVETGIGYDVCIKGSYRIYESEAWKHTHIEREKRQATNYEWVIPNYFDLDEWTPVDKPGDYVAFMGRICGAKGMNTVLEMAKRGVRIRVVGQGDPAEWKHRNIEYVGPLKGRERDSFVGGASCLLMPTAFVEPFGGSAVEAMLTGTPVLSVDWGAFTETVVPGVTGFRCKMLKDWLDGVSACRNLDRKEVYGHARARYGLASVGKLYDRAFTQLMTLQEGGGWYAGTPDPED